MFISLRYIRTEKNKVDVQRNQYKCTEKSVQKKLEYIIIVYIKFTLYLLANLKKICLPQRQTNFHIDFANLKKGSLRGYSPSLFRRSD